MSTLVTTRPSSSIFFFDVPEFDPETLRGPNTRTIADFLKKLNDDWALVYRAMHFERARALEFGNRRRAGYQFAVGQDVLVNQRKHYRDQLGHDGPLAPKAVGPYRILRRITKNTF